MEALIEEAGGVTPCVTRIRGRRDLRPLTAVVVFAISLLICTVLFYTVNDYEDSCTLCGSDESKATCHQGGLPYISYTGTNLPEQAVFTTGFWVTGALFGLSWWPMSSDLFNGRQARSIWPVRCGGGAVDGAGGCGLGLSIRAHISMVRACFVLGVFFFFMVGVVSMRIHCFWHFIGAAGTFLFLAIWAVSYTALLYRMLPPGAPEPFHLRVKRAVCWALVADGVYFVVASGFVRAGSRRHRDGRTVGALGQWLLVSSLAVTLLSEHWNPRFQRPQPAAATTGAAGIAESAKKMVPADALEAGAVAAVVVPPASPRLTLTASPTQMATL